jgi:hypothetical protein
MTPGLEELLALARQEGRVCPLPASWRTLYELLPDVRHDAYGAIPAQPLFGDLWDSTTDDAKRERLREHLLWAMEHGAGRTVYDFLSRLPPESWHLE